MTFLGPFSEILHLTNFFQVHKGMVDDCLPIGPILSAINTPIYKLGKLLGSILKYMYFLFYLIIWSMYLRTVLF